MAQAARSNVIVLPRFMKLMAGGSLTLAVGMHYFLDDRIPRSKACLKIDEDEQTITVPVWITADFHCPWAFLARASLAEAAKRYPEVKLEVKWHPTILHTTVPVVGAVPFGTWAPEHMHSEDFKHLTQTDGLIIERGKLFNIDFSMTPDQLVSSTVNAHRICYQALEQHGAEAQDTLARSIYSAYFEQRQDIGSPWVLAELAAAVGMDKDDCVRYLHTNMDREIINRFAVTCRSDESLWKGSPQMNFKCMTEPLMGTQRPDRYAEVCCAWEGGAPRKCPSGRPSRQRGPGRHGRRTSAVCCMATRSTRAAGRPAPHRTSTRDRSSRSTART